MQTFKLFYLWLLFVPFSLFAQQEVTGTVKDESGLPIPGVNITVEDSDRGTVTNFDGNYAIELSEGEILVFSYLGYQTQKVTYNGQETINVTLKTESESLDEVVLIGYGKSKKKDLTGSVTSITEKDFTKGNIITPENLINGRVAGVTVNTSGAPGSGSEIRIRGGGSLNSQNQPLVVVDGLPLSNDTPGGGRSVLSSINPNDIKSFNVLKDASATAIYGNRASAGVIIIKTKEGTEKLNVDFRTNFGVYNLTDKVDVFSADEFRELVAQRRPDDLDLLGDANTDWQDEIYRVANSIDQNVSLRGRLFGALPVRLSLGRFDQQGIRLTSEYTRNTASVALNPSFFNDHLRVNLNANYSRESNRFANAVEGAAIRFDPTQPVYDPDSPFGGFFEYSDLNNRNQLAIQNPVAALLQRNNQTDLDRWFGNLNIDYRLHFLPDARVVVNLGLDDTSGSGANELSRNSVGGNFIQENGTFEYFGSFSEFTSDSRNTLFDAYFKYNKDITKDISLRATAGYSYQKFEDESFNTSDVRRVDYDPVEDPDVFTRPDLVLIGYIGRSFVTIKDKYIFSYSIRRDGSSRFAEGNKWGTFQSAAFSWNISDENFLKDSDFISNLKLRTSYGETGQQELFTSGSIPPRLIGSQSITTSQPNAFVIIGGQAVPAAFPLASNPNLTWETAKTINIGLDYGLFNNRITGSVDAYTRDTENLLVNGPVPEGSNFTNIISQNAGTLNTKGIEIGINGQIFDAKGDTDKFDWNLNYNVTFIEQEIDQLVNGTDINTGSIAGGTGGFIQRHSEGLAPNTFFVYNQIYDNDGNPIEGAYADLNGDNIINDSDRYFYRDPLHNVTMGLQSTMNYKKFDFTFNMRANIGGYVYNNFNSSNAQYRALTLGNTLQNLPTSVLETNFNNTENVQLSDYFIENASFLRMDNIQLGYTFDNFLKNDMTTRLSFGVQNAFIITDYSGLDPEVTGGIDNTIYPRSRTYLLGLNMNF